MSDVREGQWWRDSDQRGRAYVTGQPRFLYVLDVYEEGGIEYAQVWSEATGKKSRIRTDRMKPGARGYVLAEDKKVTAATLEGLVGIAA